MFQVGNRIRGLWTHPGTGLALVMLLAIACLPAGRSQSNLPVNGAGIPRGQQLGMSSSPFDDMDSVMQQKHLLALNIERQKEMVSDANKLLKLARELNDEVGTGKATEFTPDQMRKIAEIEKLARSVRERMTSAVGPQLPSPGLSLPSGMNLNTH